MGLEVYLLVILTSLEAVIAYNDFGEGTSGRKGNNLLWFFLRNKQVSNYDRSVIIEVLFQPVSICLLFFVALEPL